jgi:hypothetical protein
MRTVYLPHMRQAEKQSAKATGPARVRSCSVKQVCMQLISALKSNEELIRQLGSERNLEVI